MPETLTIPLKRMGRLQRLRTDQCGAAAIEFALTIGPFVVLLLMAMCVAFVLFLHQQLDYATSKAGRQIMNGSVQKKVLSSTDFRQKIVCPNLPLALSCSNVIVNVQTATEAVSPGGYYTFVKNDMSGIIIPDLTTNTSTYSVGVQGSYEYLQVIYPITFLPSFITNLLSNQTYAGTPAYLLVSTVAFRNEQY